MARFVKTAGKECRHDGRALAKLPPLHDPALRSQGRLSWIPGGVSLGDVPACGSWPRASGRYVKRDVSDQGLKILPFDQKTPTSSFLQSSRDFRFLPVFLTGDRMPGIRHSRACRHASLPKPRRMQSTPLKPRRDGAQKPSRKNAMPSHEDPAPHRETARPGRPAPHRAAPCSPSSASRSAISSRMASYSAMRRARKARVIAAFAARPRGVST